ncbi:hypothetical protein [Rhodovulum sp. P5]|uniref:hypothetical protein n=1 Tax=Rhodovulum sp. P5 TaxID=1564506 RepID=UPI0009DA69B0|nr:hypothetical protein [Rhodovulum sp. P5]
METDRPEPTEAACAADPVAAAHLALDECSRLQAALTAALARATTALETALEHPVQAPVQHASERLPDATAHRAAHRPGRPPKIESDPEVRAFVLARIDFMSYEALAKAVADNFPPERRVGRTAIHTWWQRNKR